MLKLSIKIINEEVLGNDLQAPSEIPNPKGLVRNADTLYRRKREVVKMLST